MYIKLDERPIQLSGRYKGGSVERVMAWRDRAVANKSARSKRALHVHVSEDAVFDRFLKEDQVLLSTESFEDLLLHGSIYLLPEQDRHLDAEQIFGEVRELLHKGPFSARSWWRLCALIDLTPALKRAPIVHYAIAHLKRAEYLETAEIAPRYRGGINRSTRDALGAICVAPRRWLEEVARGELADRHELVRRVVVDRKDIDLVERALVTHERGFVHARSLELWQVERRVTRARYFKTPPHSLWRALCEPPLLHRMERLRLCAMHDDFLAELRRHGQERGALRTLDLSAIPVTHKRIASELFEAPYFRDLDELVCNGHQLRSFLASNAQGVKHLTLTERALDYLVDVFDDGYLAPKFGARLETLAFYDYPYGKRWEQLFASHYDGQIRELLFGVGFAKHTLDLRKDGGVELMLQRSPFLKSVHTLLLGDLLDVIDVEALLKAQPHLSVRR